MTSVIVSSRGPWYDWGRCRGRDEMKSKVFLRSVVDLTIEQATRQILEGCDWERIVAPGAAVVIKPNLNTPDPDKAASDNTDPRLVAAVVKILRERTDRIVIGEADGP